MIVKCRFCQLDYTVSNNTFGCPDCRMDYVVGPTGNFCCQTYVLRTNEYHSLQMHLDTEFTIIVLASWVSLTLKGTWPQTYPRDALALTKRLHNLLVFS